MTPVRIAMVGLAREGNTFAGGVGTVDDFRRGTWLEGDQILTMLGSNDSMAGALAVAHERGATVVPTFMARSTSGPSVTARAHAELRDEVLSGLAPVVDDVDGVYVRLHGAMTAEGCDDVEGDLLTAIRELIGPRMAMAASFDLHSHFTAQMASTTPLLTGYLTYPHVDMANTGARAMTLLLDQLAGRTEPTGGYRSIPMMSASEAHNTTTGPVAEVMRMRDDLVAGGELLDGSIFCTQPWLDLPGIGWSVVTVADGSAEVAQRCADELAAALFDRRERCVVTKVTLPEALERASHRRGEGGPVVLGDGADSPSAGSTGDSPEMLQAVLDASLDGPAICSVVDAPAVRQCIAAGLGATVTVRVGGTLSPHFFAPIEVTGTVASMVDGSAPLPGPTISSGRAVVLQIDQVSCVVSEFPTSMVDDGPYRRMGLDVGRAWVVQAKSAGQYRDGYAELAAEMIDVDMRGPSQHNLLTLPWQRATHGWWPKDPEVTRGF